MAASSFFPAACLIAIDFFREFSNPYMGILTYIIAPSFSLAGLLLISVGAIRERRRRRHPPESHRLGSAYSEETGLTGMPSRLKLHRSRGGFFYRAKAEVR